MPATYNGIGTHYYGHRNSEKHSATCHSCGRGVQLESYDTRLWFVVVFIPIIPLGRKRIIDQCPVCKRHFVADADKWETQKQLNVSGTMEEYLADPTPEKAMAAHQMLLNFHQTAQAADFRREIAEKFRQNAKLQAYLGQALLGKGQVPEAAVYFQRAFELRPDLPEARIGVAREHIRAGRLDEARALLDFLEKPGAAQLYSLEPVETLAIAYQQAGKREQALELFRVLLEGLPAIGEIASFRTRVKACEKALGRKESILPKWKFSWKRFFGRGGARPKQPGSIHVTWRGLAIAVAVVAVFISFFFIHNLYQRHHRQLFIVNGLRDAATVEIRDVGTVEVPGGGRGQKKLEVAEGHYHVTITGPVRETLDIDITKNDAADNPIWLLNVGGAALLVEEHVTYRKDNPPPPEIVPHFGQTFERINEITHPFTALPTTLSMSSHETQRVLTNLDFSQNTPEQVLTWLQLRARTGEAARLAEWRLKSHPEDGNALAVFAELAPAKHVEEVLQAGLGRRPVEMQWHRIYQNLHRGAQWYGWMSAVYDGMVKAEPTNSALLYLRGRVATERGDAAKWFTQAREADARNPFPYYALGYERISAGDWAAARPLLAQAAALSPEGPGFSEALFTCRLALEEYAPLEKELRQVIAKQPFDFSTKLELVYLLLAQGRPTEAAQVVTAVDQQAAKNSDAGLTSLATNIRWRYLYAAGDFEHLAKSAEKDRTPAGRTTFFVALLEQGKVADALRAHPLDKADAQDASTLLSVSLAWAAAGDNAQATTWLRRALPVLQAGGPDEVRAAALFAKDAALTPEALDAVVLDCKEKSIVLTALGLLHPEKRAELFAAARRLNMDRSFPYHLVARMTAERH